MELPIIDRFCFAVSLKKGCLIMGIFNSILTFVLAVMMCACAVDMREAGEQRGEDAMSSVVYTIVVLLAVLLFIKFLITPFFVYAVYKGKWEIVKKFCMLAIVFLVLFLIGILKTLFHMGLGYVGVQLFYFVQFLYYTIVVRSYMVAVREDGGM